MKAYHLGNEWIQDSGDSSDWFTLVVSESGEWYVTKEREWDDQAGKPQKTTLSEDQFDKYSVDGLPLVRIILAKLREIGLKPRKLMTKNRKVFKVLIVDDSYDDRFFLRSVLERFPRFLVVGEVCDGADAIAYLSGQTVFSDRETYPFPDLIFLDLKMPRKTGFDVLSWLRTQSFPGLTVLMLSNSPLGEDIGAALALGAHGYWTKPAQYQKYRVMAEEIETLLDQRWEQHH